MSSATLSSEMTLCGEYKLQKPIGQGGMGQIWLAQDLSCKRDVALKFVPPEIQHSTDEMARVERMFHLMHSLHHEHICPMYTMKDGGLGIGTFLVMQYIAGKGLNHYFAETKSQTGGLPLSRVTEILRPIASALDYAHTRRQPVIHRDVKPSNILVVTGENNTLEDVQLIDFGLAETFRTSISRISMAEEEEQEIIGTREYMAPEQWLGHEQNAATDQYALAVTAYELLSGHLPFESTSFTILKDCVLNNPPQEIAGLSAHANAALLKALSKKIKDRFDSCIHFIDALAAENKAGKHKSKNANNGPKSKRAYVISFVALLAALLAGAIYVGISRFPIAFDSNVQAPVGLYGNAQNQTQNSYYSNDQAPAGSQGSTQGISQGITQETEQNKNFLQYLAIQFAQDKWLGDVTDEILVRHNPQDFYVKTDSYLSVINNQIEDEVLTWFSALPNLKKITFTNCEKITEAGWLELKNCKNLESLIFHNCENFTHQDLLELQEALPNCEILVE